MPSVSPLEALGQDVSYLASHVKAAADSACSASGVSSAGCQVLGTLMEHGEQTVARIGRLCDTSRQNTRMLVKRLAQGGLVEFAENPEHQRSSLVRLTEAGVTLFNLAVERRNEALAKSFSIVPELVMRAASAALRRVAESLGSGDKRTITPRLTDRRKVATRPQVVRPSVSRPQQPAVADEIEDNQLPVNLL